MATKRVDQNDVVGNKKQKLRNYHEFYLVFRFIQSVLNPDKSECIFCGMVLSKDSMKPPKLKIHRQETRQSTVEQDDIFFVDRKKEYMRRTRGGRGGRAPPRDKPGGARGGEVRGARGALRGGQGV